MSTCVPNTVASSRCHSCPLGNCFPFGGEWWEFKSTSGEQLAKSELKSHPEMVLPVFFCLFVCFVLF